MLLRDVDRVWIIVGFFLPFCYRSHCFLLAWTRLYDFFGIIIVIRFQLDQYPFLLHRIENSAVLFFHVPKFLYEKNCT